VRRELSAERRAHSPKLFSQPLWFAGPKNPIGKKRRKKIRSKQTCEFRSALSIIRWYSVPGDRITK
jgi:hypothetical protein